MEFNKLDLSFFSFLKKMGKKYFDYRNKNFELKQDKIWKKKFINGDFEHYIDDNLKIIMYEDSILSKVIYYGFEKDEIMFVQEYLKKGDYFLDIGSNIGLFSLYASKIVGESGRVFAFEPALKTYTRLQKNIAINNLNNITANRLGVSDKKGTLQLNVSENGHDAWNSFAEIDSSYYSGKESVEVVTIDDYLKEFNVDAKKIKIMKVDVEGWEVQVLKGAADFLKNYSPILMVEFTEQNSLAAGHCCHVLYDVAVNLGYKWYTFDSKEKKLIPSPKQLNYPYENLFAFK